MQTRIIIIGVVVLFSTVTDVQGGACDKNNPADGAVVRMCYPGTSTSSSRVYLEIDLKPSDAVTQCSCKATLKTTSTTTHQINFYRATNWPNCNYRLNLEQPLVKGVFSCSKRTTGLTFNVKNMDTVDVTVNEDIANGKAISTCVVVDLNQMATGAQVEVTCQQVLQVQPPTTTPPMTTQPPVTTPLIITQPPVTTPPVTTPLIITQPQVTTPLIITQPQVTTPPVTTPLIITQPQVTTPLIITQPQVTTPTIKTQPPITTQQTKTQPPVTSPPINTQPPKTTANTQMTDMSTGPAAVTQTSIKTTSGQPTNNNKEKINVLNIKGKVTQKDYSHIIIPIAVGVGSFLLIIAIIGVVIYNKCKDDDTPDEERQDFSNIESTEGEGVPNKTLYDNVESDGVPNKAFNGNVDGDAVPTKGIDGIMEQSSEQTAVL